MGIRLNSSFHVNPPRGPPPTAAPDQITIDMPMSHAFESGPTLGVVSKPSVLDRTRNAATTAGLAIRSTAANTAGKIMQKLGGMGGAIHQALRSNDRIANANMEWGGNNIEVESDNDNPNPRRNLRIRPVATKDTSISALLIRRLLGRYQNHKLYFQ